MILGAPIQGWALVLFVITAATVAALVVSHLERRR